MDIDGRRPKVVVLVRHRSTQGALNPEQLHVIAHPIDAHLGVVHQASQREVNDIDDLGGRDPNVVDGRAITTGDVERD